MLPKQKTHKKTKDPPQKKTKEPQKNKEPLFRVHDENDGEAGAAAAEAGPPPEGSAAEASAPVAGADMQKEGEEGL